MTKPIVLSLLATVLFIKLQSTAAQSAIRISEAKLIGVTKGVDNFYMTVMEDEDVISGWDTDVKSNISKRDNVKYFSVLMYTRTDQQEQFVLDEPDFEAPLCTLLEHYKDVYGYEDHLTTEIINMIFPRQKGSCFFKVGDNPIRARAQVHTDASAILETAFPREPPYELEVHILDGFHGDEPDEDPYVFKVNFNIGGDINNK